MALINCLECGKEISDKSDVCINCGAPIKIEPKVTYKKFDFDGLRNKLDDLEFLEKYNTAKIKDSESEFKWGAIFFIVFGIIAFLDIWIFFRIISGFISFACIILILKSLFVLTFTKKTSPISDDVILDKFYKDMVYLFSISPKYLEYEAISFIKASSEDELLKKAFELKADAIINLNLNEYSTSNVSSSFNGVGAQRTISTNVKHHQNWNGTAVRIINSNEYHTVDLEKLLIMA